MIRRLIIGCIVVFWLTMMGVLVHREVLPAWTTARRPTYRTADLEEDLPRRTQMGIYLKQQRVGTCRNVVRRDPDGLLLIEGTSSMEVALRMLPVRTRFDVSHRFRVGQDGRLRRFRVDTTGPGLRIAIRGEVVGRDLVVTSRMGQQEETWTFPYEPRDVLAHDLGAMEGLGELRVGQRWHLQSVNPLTGNLAISQVEVRDRETITWQGQSVETFLLVSNAGGMETRAWVTPEGEVLRQELPIGFLLEREPFDEAVSPGVRIGAGAGSAGQ